jgi:phosphoribosylformimino-5-aminoimidazole carboxamide ribotide isomerase
MRFRPCIDLRDGRVVQIVGGTLDDAAAEEAVVNFETERLPAEFARLYQQDDLTGGHVIALGPGNRDAMISALEAFPGGLQAGGGVTAENAGEHLDAGASHVIVTSYVFSAGQVDMDRLGRLVAAVGRERLVLDLSCRKRGSDFWVVTDRWQRFTDVSVNAETLGRLAEYCDEFLVHGVDVEGKMLGVQAELVELLGEHSPLPVTYAGGANALSDLARVNELGQGRVDLTIGSALDIFGGAVAYRDVVNWQRGLGGERNQEIP